MDNLRVTPNLGDNTRMSASFTTPDARYHVWFYPDTMELAAPILYKNPPAGVGYKTPGYFDTRKLDAKVRKNAALIAALLKEVVERKLVEHAVQKVRDDNAQAARAQYIQTLARDFWVARMRGEAYPEIPKDVTEDEFRAASIRLASSL